MHDILNRLFNWDFIRMGKGIESRYSRCPEHWAPHLTCSQTFIKEHLQPGGRIAILGAGRLLDINLGSLIPLFEEIHLFDADPTVIKTWRRASGSAFRRSVIPRIVDITGSLAQWTSGLPRARKRGRLWEYLNALEVNKGPWELDGFDGVISLNLLGQLPIYWRDRVLQAVRSLSQEEEAALEGTMAKLQIAHLRALREAPRVWSIVITDTEYYTYRVDEAEWGVDLALHGEALTELRAPKSENFVAGDTCWLWHLAPQFIESESEGHIHRVEAAAWHLGRPHSTLGQASYRARE